MVQWCFHNISVINILLQKVRIIEWLTIRGSDNNNIQLIKALALTVL
jgi:hypothetical protein